MTRTLESLGTLESFLPSANFEINVPVQVCEATGTATGGRHQIDTITLENCLAIYIKANIYLHYGQQFQCWALPNRNYLYENDHLATTQHSSKLETT